MGMIKRKEFKIKASLEFNKNDVTKLTESLKKVKSELTKFQSLLTSDKFDFQKSIREAFLGKGNSGSTIVTGMKKMIKDITKSTIKEMAKSVVIVSANITKGGNKIKEETKKSQNGLLTILAAGIAKKQELAKKQAKIDYENLIGERKTKEKFRKSGKKIMENIARDKMENILLIQKYMMDAAHKKEAIRRKEIENMYADILTMQKQGQIIANNEKKLKDKIIKLVKNANKIRKREDDNFHKSQVKEELKYNKELARIKAQNIRNVKIFAKSSFNVLTTGFSGLVKSLKTLKPLFNNIMSLVNHLWSRLKQLLKYATIALTTVTALTIVLSNRFLKFGMTILSATEKMRAYNIGLLGMMKTQSGVNSLMKTALDITKDMPIAYDQVFASVKAFALIGPVKQMLKDTTKTKSILKQMFKITLALSQIEPEWGMQGAIFSLREAMSGDLRSLQRRFEIPVNLIFGKDGRSIRDMKNDPAAMADALEGYMDTFFNDKTLKMSARQFSAIMAKIQGVFTKFYNDVGESGFYDQVTSDLQRLYEWLNKLSESEAFKIITTKLGNMYTSIYKSAKNIFSTVKGGIVSKLFGNDETKQLKTATNFMEAFAKSFRVLAKMIADEKVQEQVKKSLESSYKTVSKYGKMFKDAVVEVYDTLKTNILKIGNIFTKGTKGISGKTLTKGAIYVWLFGRSNILNLIGNVTTSILSIFSMLTSSITALFLAMSTTIGTSLLTILAPLSPLIALWSSVKGLSLSQTLGISDKENNVNYLKRQHSLGEQQLSDYYMSMKPNGKARNTFNSLFHGNIDQKYNRITSSKENLNKFLSIQPTTESGKILKPIVDESIKKQLYMNQKQLDASNELATAMRALEVVQKDDLIQQIKHGINSGIDIGKKILDIKTEFGKSLEKIIDTKKKNTNATIKNTNATIKNTQLTAEQVKQVDSLPALTTKQGVNTEKLTNDTIQAAQLATQWWKQQGYKFEVTSGYRPPYKDKNGNWHRSDHNYGRTIDAQIFSTNGSPLSKAEFNDPSFVKKLNMFYKMMGYTKMLLEYKPTGKYANFVDSSSFSGSSFKLNTTGIDPHAKGYPVLHVVNPNLNHAVQNSGIFSYLKNKFINTYANEGNTPVITPKQPDIYADILPKLKMMYTYLGHIDSTSVGNLNNANPDFYTTFLKTGSNNGTAMYGSGVEKKLLSEKRTALSDLNKLQKLTKSAETAKVKTDSMITLVDKMKKYAIKRNQIEKYFNDALEKNNKATVAMFKKAVDFKSFKYADVSKLIQEKRMTSYNSQIRDEIEKKMIANRTFGQTQQDVENNVKAVDKIVNQMIVGRVKTFTEGIKLVKINKTIDSTNQVNQLLKSLSIINGFILPNKTKLLKDKTLELSVIDEKKTNQQKQLLKKYYENVKNTHKMLDAYTKFNNKQKDITNKISKFNFTQMDKLINYYNTAMTGNRASKQKYFSQYQANLENAPQDSASTMQMAVKSIQQTRKNASELAYEFAISLNNSLESVFQNGFFNMLTHGFKDFGGFLKNIFNSILGSVATSISKQLAQSATDMLMPVLVGKGGTSGLLSGLFGGGLFSRRSSNATKYSLAVGGNIMGSIMGKMGVPGSSQIINDVTGFSNNSSGGGLFGGKGGLIGSLATKIIPKTWITAGKSALSGISKFVGANALPVAGALGLGYLAFRKGGVFGGRVDHTGKAKAAYASANQTYAGYVSRRTDDAGKYLYANDTMSNYNFSAPVYWNTHSGNGWTSKRTTTGHVSTAAFSASIAKYMKLLDVASKENYMKQIELNKLAEQNKVKSITIEMNYQQKYLSMIKTKYDEFMKTGNWAKVDEYRDKVAEQEKTIVESRDSLVEAIKEHAYTVKEYNSWLASNQGDNISYQKTLLDIQKSRLDELKIGEDKWYEANKNYLDAKRKYAENLATIEKTNQDDLGKSVINVIKYMNTRNKTFNNDMVFGSASVIQDTKLINKLRSGNYTNADIQGLTKFQSVSNDKVVGHATTLSGGSVTIHGTTDIPIESVSTMIQKLTDRINDNIASMSKNKAIMESQTGIINMLTSGGQHDYTSQDYLNLLNGRKQVINSTNLTTKQKISGADDFNGMITNMATSMSTDLNSMINSGLLNINDTLLKTYIKAIDDGSYMANDTIVSIYENIKKSFTKEQFKSGILSTFKDDTNWDIFNKVKNDKALSSDYIQNYLSGIIGTKTVLDKNKLKYTNMWGNSFISNNPLGITAETANKNYNLYGWKASDVYKQENLDPYQSYFNFEKKRLVTALNNQTEGTPEWAKALNDLFQFITDDAKRTKAKADEASKALNDSLSAIEATMKIRIAEERKSSKGDITYIDINNRDSRSLLDDMINRLDTSDPKAIEAINAMKQRLIGVN